MPPENTQENVETTLVGGRSPDQGNPHSSGIPAYQSPEILPGKWLEIIRKEYLQSYLLEGGTTIKFVVLSDEEQIKSCSTHLEGMAKEEGFVFTKVDARYTKAHMVDRLFHKIARQLDWDDLAYHFVVRLLIDNGYTVPEERRDFTLQRVAELNERKEPLLRRDLQTWLEQTIEADPKLCREFRMAMIRICLAQLSTGESDLVLANAVKEWLSGNLRLISSVKKALIFQKIARHNARHILSSLTHWLRLTGKGGLIMALDISRFLVTKRPAEPDATFFYSPSTTLDLYEMLRQFIDASDEIEGLMMTVMSPPQFLTDSRRGLDRYEALKLRIWDDVRDKHHQNPLAPLIRLAPQEETNGVLHLHRSDNPQTSSETIVPRKVIEGLRAGVPNRHIVASLGCPQAEIEGRFRRLLDWTKNDTNGGSCPKGMVIEGGFGSGKSHVLEYLQNFALESNFICSRVVISKETPFYNPVRMFYAAVESCVIPNKRGEVLPEIAGNCEVWTPRFKELVAWVNSPESQMDSRFAATLFLYSRMGTDQELGFRMTRFWTGDPIGVGELKKYLKECGVAGQYAFNSITAHSLALQRFQFTSRLMQAAGYAGWILLIDEAELIGRYSMNQRAKSYTELARLMSGPGAMSIPGLGVVVALTNDFKSEVLEKKGDRVILPERLREKQTDADTRLAESAETGMSLIETERIPLGIPTGEMIKEAHRTIHSLYLKAHAWYDWDHQSESSIQTVPGSHMRSYVKSWITEWDLRRLAPDENVEIEVTSLKNNYEEDKELEPVDVENDHSSFSKVNPASHTLSSNQSP